MIGATSPRGNDPLRGGAVLPFPREGKAAIGRAVYDSGPPAPSIEEEYDGRDPNEEPPIDFDDGPPF
jgi:hypothetical protein